MGVGDVEMRNNEGWFVALRCDWYTEHASTMCSTLTMSPVVSSQSTNRNASLPISPEP